MFSRRHFFAGLAGLAACTTSQASASDRACLVFSADRQHSLTPMEAIEMLKKGNERFTHGESINCNLMDQVRQTSGNQYPFAAILGCIDSRVPPELVFDQRIGDVFCARIAGNVASTEIIGSLEYATAVAGAKAIVVLGHSSCGAIKSTIDGVRLGNITALLDHIEPATHLLEQADGPKTSENTVAVQKLAEFNARFSADSILEHSELIREKVHTGELIVQVAMHDVNSGRVSWLD